MDDCKRSLSMPSRLEREVLGARLWHGCCQELNGDLPASVPLSFPDAAAYVATFEPLLFEEAREGVRSAWAEAAEGARGRVWPANIARSASARPCACWPCSHASHCHRRLFRLRVLSCPVASVGDTLRARKPKSYFRAGDELILARAAWKSRPAAGWTSRWRRRRAPSSARSTRRRGPSSS